MQDETKRGKGRPRKYFDEAGNFIGAKNFDKTQTLKAKGIILSGDLIRLTVEDEQKLQMACQILGLAKREVISKGLALFYADLKLKATQ